MIVWGALSGLTAFAQGYTSLVIIRFLLGFVEAYEKFASTPLILLILSLGPSFQEHCFFYRRGTRKGSWPFALPFSIQVVFSQEHLAGL